MTRLRNFIPASSFVFLSLSFLAILSVFVIDWVILDISLFAEGPPKFEYIYLLRTALIVLSSAFFVISIIQAGAMNKDSFFPYSVSETWNDWGLITWSKDDSIKQPNVSLSAKVLMVWAVLFISLFFLFVFLTHPIFFSRLGREDNPIETMSAILYFLNCGLFLYISFLLYRQPSNAECPHWMISLSFAFVFFLVGMEEVSWLQRILSIETPNMFSGNLKNETNLHNFATNEFENAYYFTSFIFLVIVPFLHDKCLPLHLNKPFSFFMPSIFILFVSDVFVTYNYDMWNIALTQLSFFVTFFILAHYTWLYLREDNLNLLSPVAVILMVLTQTLFSIFGNRFVKRSDITEYKEFFIPLAFLLYSFEILLKTRKLRANVV